MSRGAALITPNNRLSKELLHDYFQQQSRPTMLKPYCMPFDQMLEHEYNVLTFKTADLIHPTLLNYQLCLHLWRKIIKSTSNIAFNEGLLKAVIESWVYCEQWQLEAEHHSFNYTAQTQQFQQWWKAFNEHLKHVNAITQYQLIPILIRNLGFFQKIIIWVCFDEFTPQQIALQQALTREGIEQYAYDLNKKCSQTTLFKACDTKEEYQQLIGWLQIRIQAGDKKIGVVVPKLQQEALPLERLLKNHFEASVFNLYLGQTLGAYHLVAHALTWIKLDTTMLTAHEVALLLQSPYLAHAEDEFYGRSQCLQDNKLLQEQNLPIQRLCSELTPYAPKLGTLLSSLKAYPKEASLQEWILLFQARLQSMGFPGEAVLSSENYQCLMRFTTLFDEFRQLTFLTSKFMFDEALEAFCCLINTTTFQAQKKEATIQVSGLLEASGCAFDSLWITGLTDEALPQKTKLSAFINPQIQRQLQMPHSTHHRELLFAQQILDRLQGSCPNVIFSYPRMQGERQNLPCSLMRNHHAYTPIVFTALPLSELLIREENYQLPLKTCEFTQAGSALLANQAKCPFKAFAEHRLHAKAPMNNSDGLNPQERGQIIHKVMELLWRQLGSQEKLIQMPTATLEQHVESAIQSTLLPLKQSYPSSFTSPIEQVEFARLKNLVFSTLEWEKQRPPFEIAAIEQTYIFRLADLNFKVRVDRLDTVNDSKWLIDYKSSIPSSKPWNEDRPKEPQLLLYSLLDEQINTLFFMQLKSGKINFCGISEESLDIPGITTLKKEQHWSQVKLNWQQQLTSLAFEFQQGHCTPAPANPSICLSCDFRNLCRFQKD
ncbi:MAG: PD-(D/E)XK nuclease family protein [Legionella sp.]|nr:PD-(D/E)XK nuclease family protein [Legionella sp.]